MAFILSSPLWLDHASYLIAEIRIEAEVHGLFKSEVPYDKLVYLRFSKDELADLRWEHDREFEYDEQMYDVVGLEICGDTIGYWCWLDHKEKRIKTRWAAQWNRFGADEMIQPILTDWSDWHKTWCNPRRVLPQPILFANRIPQFILHMQAQTGPFVDSPPPELLVLA